MICSRSSWWRQNQVGGNPKAENHYRPMGSQLIHRRRAKAELDLSCFGHFIVRKGFVQVIEFKYLSNPYYHYTIFEMKELRYPEVK